MRLSSRRKKQAKAFWAWLRAYIEYRMWMNRSLGKIRRDRAHTDALAGEKHDVLLHQIRWHELLGLLRRTKKRARSRPEDQPYQPPVPPRNPRDPFFKEEP